MYQISYKIDFLTGSSSWLTGSEQACYEVGHVWVLWVTVCKKMDPISKELQTSKNRIVYLQKSELDNNNKDNKSQ